MKDQSFDESKGFGDAKSLIKETIIKNSRKDLKPNSLKTYISLLHTLFKKMDFKKVEDF
jgi:hypothetical protein